MIYWQKVYLSNRDTAEDDSLPCKMTSSNASRHGSIRMAASIDTSAFISSSDGEELSLLLLLPTAELSQ